MNFGIAVMIVLAVWALLSIAVSVTIGRVAGFRDDQVTPQLPDVRELAGRERERVAS